MQFDYCFFLSLFPFLLCIKDIGHYFSFPTFFICFFFFLVFCYIDRGKNRREKKIEDGDSSQGSPGGVVTG